MADTVYARLGILIASLVIGFAFTKGDEPERVGAGAYAMGLLASLLLQNDSPLAARPWSLLTADAALLAVFVAVAWKSRRSWPVWAAALQTLIVMSHLLTFIDPRPPLAAFYAVINLASFGILLTLALGTACSWRDREAA